MKNIDNELRLTNHQRMILGAIRTGRNDLRIGAKCSIDKHNARKGSAWAKWYEHGFAGFGIPNGLKGCGVEI